MTSLVTPCWCPRGDIAEAGMRVDFIRWRKPPIVPTANARMDGIVDADN